MIVPFIEVKSCLMASGESFHFCGLLVVMSSSRETEVIRKQRKRWLASLIPAINFLYPASLLWGCETCGFVGSEMCVSYWNSVTCLRITRELSAVNEWLFWLSSYTGGDVSSKMWVFLKLSHLFMDHEVDWLNFWCYGCILAWLQVIHGGISFSCSWYWETCKIRQPWLIRNPFQLRESLPLILTWLNCPELIDLTWTTLSIPESIPETQLS